MKKLCLILTFILTFIAFSLNVCTASIVDPMGNAGVESEKLYMEAKVAKIKAMLQKIDGKVKNFLNKECTIDMSGNFISQIESGKYITAFNICKKEGGSIEECIQKVEDAKLNWKNNSNCSKSKEILPLMHLYYLLIARGNAYYVGTENPICSPIFPKISDKLPNSMIKGGGNVSGYLNREICSRILNYVFPGSQFNYLNYSGFITAAEGPIYFQAGEFLYWDSQIQNGINMQVYNNRINYKLGQYNIAVHIDYLPQPQDDEEREMIEAELEKYEIVEFNLPIDAQVENILLEQGKGIKVTNKEIISIVNKFFHDTAWGVNAQSNFIGLLTQDNARKFFLDCLKEYLTYDNYIKTVKEPKKANETSQPKKTTKKPTKKYKE